MANSSDASHQMDTATREQMLKARTYIQYQEFDKARQILRKLDHPKAKEWLALLPKPNRQRAVVAYVLFIIAIGLIVFIITNEQVRQSFNTALKVVLTPQSLSRSVSAEPTLVEPTMSADNSRQNPFPYDTKLKMSLGNVGDAMMGLVGIERGLDTHAIDPQNQVPNPGQEWVLATIIVSCHNGSTCNYDTLTNFSLIGYNNKLYKSKIILGLPADLKFPTTISANHKAGGTVGFIINHSDSNLQLVYRPNDQKDKQYYFASAEFLVGQ